jgi:hypothetical protein
MFKTKVIWNVRKRIWECKFCKKTRHIQYGINNIYNYDTCNCLGAKKYEKNISTKR